MAEENITRSRRILIADEDEDAIEILEILLTLDGHDVKTSLSGTDAFDIAKEFLPEIILFYAGMQGIDGREAVAHFTRAAPEATLVALFDWHRKDELEDWRGAGCHYCLIKPVRAADVNGLLKQIGA